MNIIQTITDICREIVEHPEELRVKDIGTKSCAFLKIHAHDHDVTKLIGKHGATVQALSRIAQNLYGEKLVKIAVDTEGCDEVYHRNKFKPNATYDPTYHVNLLEEVCQSLFGAEAYVSMVKLDDYVWAFTIKHDDVSDQPDTIKDLAVLWGAMGKNHGATIIVEVE